MDLPRVDLDEPSDPASPEHGAAHQHRAVEAVRGPVSPFSGSIGRARLSLNDTLSGFEALAETTREKNIVVWLNEYFGPVLKDGAGFANMPVCKKHANKLHGSVAIVRRTADTFGRDMEEMISRKLAFDEAVKATDFTIMTKQRLLVVQRDLFEQLDRVGLL